MQNGVTLHENSKRETYAFNAKCSTIFEERSPAALDFSAAVLVKYERLRARCRERGGLFGGVKPDVCRHRNHEMRET